MGCAIAMNKNKTIGILTYHTGFNYGASLQAYALQTVIKNMGYSCEIINFETESFLASREMFSRKPRRVKEFLKIVTRLPYYTVLKRRQRLFDDYTQECLQMSSLYRTEQDVIKHAEEYECIVCGSDQIWNLSENAGPAANKLFYLNFPKLQRRVSYAASFGKWVNDIGDLENELLPLLREFDYISVREDSGKKYLESKGINCKLTLDPTVLLNKEDYNSICAERQIEYPYVLLFSWLCGDEVIKAAKKVAKELHLPLFSLTPPPRTIGTGIKRKLDVGPREFLSMIKYAEFVITDSFHGTAFSTTFEKAYISVVTNGSADTRMSSLLSQLGLQDHLVGADNIDIEAMQKTDFSKVRQAKDELRKVSFSFLTEALTGLGNIKND